MKAYITFDLLDFIVTAFTHVYESFRIGIDVLIKY